MNAPPPSGGSFLRRTAPALAVGFLMAFASSAGQTFFVSLFSGELRAELGLSHGGFGAIYSLATVGSALSLGFVGKLADRFSVTPLAAAVAAGLGLACLGISYAREASLLLISLFALRLLGQGMMSHLTFTAMGRWFHEERGRALSVATLGFPAGSATLPLIVAALLESMDWRAVWRVSALFYVLLLLPLVLFLGRRARRFDSAPRALGGEESRRARDWTRAEMLRDPRWYAVMLSVLMPPFIVTGILFHQIHLVETKGWELTAFAATYPLYAGCATLVSLSMGPLVDRFGAVRLLPFYLLPLAGGLACLALLDGGWVGPVFMALLGCTSGGASIVLGALWPELYGVRHLGSIRALVMAAMVSSTALAPGSMGWLIDRGISLELQVAVLAFVTLGGALINTLLQPAFAAVRRQKSG